MGVELLYTTWPIVNGTTIVQGLIKKTSVDELKQLLKATNLDNCIIEIPPNNAPNYPSQINSTELKNFFNTHAGSKIFVLPNKSLTRSTLIFP